MSTKVNWHSIQSSQIKRIAHDAENQTAIVHFNSGAIYEYKNFPPEKFELFKASESAGKFLGSEVKGKHDFIKATGKYICPKCSCDIDGDGLCGCEEITK